MRRVVREGPPAVLCRPLELHKLCLNRSRVPDAARSANRRRLVLERAARIVFAGDRGGLRQVAAGSQAADRGADHGETQRVRGYRIFSRCQRSSVSLLRTVPL